MVPASPGDKPSMGPKSLPSISAGGLGNLENMQKNSHTWTPTVCNVVAFWATTFEVLGHSSRYFGASGLGSFQNFLANDVIYS